MNLGYVRGEDKDVRPELRNLTRPLIQRTTFGQALKQIP
jgi:hypothetical protein